MPTYTDTTDGSCCCGDGKLPICEICGTELYAGQDLVISILTKTGCFEDIIDQYNANYANGTVFYMTHVNVIPPIVVSVDPQTVYNSGASQAELYVYCCDGTLHVVWNSTQWEKIEEGVPGLMYPDIGGGSVFPDSTCTGPFLPVVCDEPPGGYQFVCGVRSSLIVEEATVTTTGPICDESGFLYQDFSFTASCGTLTVRVA